MPASHVPTRSRRRCRLVLLTGLVAAGFSLSGCHHLIHHDGPGRGHYKHHDKGHDKHYGKHHDKGHGKHGGKHGGKHHDG